MIIGCDIRAKQLANVWRYRPPGRCARGPVCSDPFTLPDRSWARYGAGRRGFGSAQVLPSVGGYFFVDLVYAVPDGDEPAAPPFDVTLLLDEAERPRWMPELVLGVSLAASEEAVRSASHRCQCRFHSDRPTGERISEVWNYPALWPPIGALHQSMTSPPSLSPSQWQHRRADSTAEALKLNTIQSAHMHEQLECT